MTGPLLILLPTSSGSVVALYVRRLCCVCACVCVQAQLGDALGDVAVAKRREEGVRGEAQKLTARLSAAQVVRGAF